MPTAEARAIFAEAQQLVEALIILHDRQHAMVEKLRFASTAEALKTLHAQIGSMQAVSLDLSKQYAEAVDRYVAAVSNSLGDGVPPALA
jgi:hypothetical protein